MALYNLSEECELMVWLLWTKRRLRDTEQFVTIGKVIRELNRE